MCKPTHLELVARASLLLGSILFAPRVSGEDVLILQGAIWRFDDSHTDLGMAWREPAFDDSLWPSGPAQLGFGDGDEMTVLDLDDEMNNFTYYFRHHFDVLDPSAYGALVLRLICDDGCAVYLNGVEIARRNLPAGPLDYFTFAVAALGPGENEWQSFPMETGALVAGENVVAVEVHQVSTGSGDLSFDLEARAIDPVPLPDFVRGDCNSDGVTDGVSDAVFALWGNFLGGAEAACRAACDANSDGDTTGVADAVFLLSHNFLGSAPPDAPYPGCGFSDSAADTALGCAASPGCQ